MNFGPVMATAAKLAVAEVRAVTDELLPRERMQLPGVYIDRVVTRMSALNRLQITWRAAQDIGTARWSISASACRCIARTICGPDVDVILQSENGVIGVGPLAAPDKADTDLVDAGSRRITLRPGASIVDSSWSFAMIRGGHIDVTILGAFEVAANGDLANWDMRVPNRGPLVGGAMDLAACAREVRVIMEHVTRKGAPRLLEKCALPLTAVRCVSRVYTDLAVVDVTPQGFVVREMVEISRDELQAQDRRAADVCAGLQAATAPADRCWTRSRHESMNFIEANGVSLRYAVEGAGKPMVLIHEMGGTMESWGLVAPMLAAKRRVVRYDTRGAGLSEKSAAPLTIDTMTDDLIALLDALGITEKVALAGTAVGGAIALHTAVRFPDRVAAVIVTSPATSHSAGQPRGDAGARRDEFEREGVRVAFEATADNGYPEELRSDTARFEAFRARWLAQRSGELRGDLPHARRHGPGAGACRDQMPGAGDRRRVRSRPSAGRVEPIAKAIPGAQFKVLPNRALCGLADAGADGGGDRRRFWMQSARERSSCHPGRPASGPGP